MKTSGPAGTAPAAVRIGPLVVDPPLFLAPMAGYTDWPFRILCRRMGAAMTFTEMVTSDGIVRGSPQTMHYLETHPDEHPLGAHLYGADIDIMARAAQAVEALGRYDAIDINCGCPVAKIRRRGAGVGLMKDPQKLHDMVKAMVGAVKLPVTVKTRLGFTPATMNIREIAHAVEEAGAAALFLHARTAEAVFSGPPNLEMLRQIKQELKIPVIGNGGIRTPAQAREMLDLTGVDGVMIGRGAIGNPWIFKAIRADWLGGREDPPSGAEKNAVICAHLEDLVVNMRQEDQRRKRRRHTAENAACRKIRGHLARYINGVPGTRDFLRQLNSLETIPDVQRAVAGVLLSSSHSGAAPSAPGTP